MLKRAIHTIMATKKMTNDEIERCAAKLAARLYKKAWFELTDQQKLGLKLAVLEIEGMIYGT